MRSRYVTLLLAVLAIACSAGSSSPSTGAAGIDSGTPTEGSAGADTWTSYASAFFTTYCTSCHNAQDPTGRDFSIQANVEKDKPTIRCGVAVTQDPSWTCTALPVVPKAKQFPIGNGPRPSDAERTRLVAWVTAGGV